MNSCVLSIRRIASNLLWRNGELLRNPLVTLNKAGCVVSVETCSEPDRMAHTEFWAGILVVDFPEDYASVFAQMKMQSGVPLPKLLMRLVSASGALVVISGLDYQTLCLTSQSRIQLLMAQIGR